MLQDKSITLHFSLFHAYARSLHKNLDNLSTYLNNLAFTFSITAITETWATSDNESFLHSAGFTRVFKNRPSGRGGGVALFVRNNLSFKHSIKCKCH